MKHAAIGPISIHFPDQIETNDDLVREFPDWDLELIASKTGIRQRYIAGPNECASDLGSGGCDEAVRGKQYLARFD